MISLERRSIMPNLYALPRTVSISEFNRGKANKIFSSVKTEGTTIVLKNNAPECVLLSPETYDRLIKRLEELECYVDAGERWNELTSQPIHPVQEVAEGQSNTYHVPSDEGKWSK